MLEKYLQKLYRQYCESEGIDIEHKPYELSYDFIKWIANNSLLLNEYSDYLQYLGFYYDEDDTLEVGKGRYDSLAVENMQVVSEFGCTQGKETSRLFIQDGTPYIISESGIAIPKQKTILTHNPYSSEDILNWFSLHNSKEKNISIGMFGNISHANAKSKIKVLEKIASQMTNDYSFDFDTDNDKYFCSLNSKRYVKKKCKTIWEK